MRGIPVAVRRHIYSALKFVVNFVAILFVLLQLPYTMEHITLDWSWQGALTYFQDHHFHFGSQVLYTYGPLGYMMTGMFVGGDYDALAFGKLLYQFVFACTAALFAVRINSFFFYVGLFGSLFLYSRYEFDSVGILLIVFASMLCVGSRATPMMAVFSSLVLSFVSLVKFTFFVFSLFSLLCILGYFLLVARRKLIAPFALAYVIGFVTFWTIVAHQTILDIPSFIRGSSEVAYGYNQTMATPAPPEIMMPTALLVFAFVALLVLLTWITVAWQTGLTRIFILGFATFLVWKQGFVRADYGHIIVVPLALQIMAMLAFSLVMAETRNSTSATKHFLPPIRKAMAMALATVLLCGVMGGSFVVLHLISRTQEFSSLGSLSEAINLFKERLNTFSRYSVVKQYQKTKFLEARRAYTLAKFSEIIKDKTVDVFGDDIGIALLNGWNYHPRPMVQSFSAYTSYLEALNENFIKSDNAPEFYVLKSQPIDDRLLPETDCPALLAILARYDPISTGNGFWLFKKRSNAQPVSPTFTEISGSTLLGQPIPITSLPPGTVDEVSIFLHPTLLGRLSLKQGWAILQTTQKSGSRVDVKVPLLLGKLGFVMNPPLLSDLDLYSTIVGGSADTVRSLSVIVQDEFKSYFQPNFTYRIRRIQDIFVVHNTTGLLPALIGFDAQPYKIESPTPQRIYSVDNTDVFFIHAPSRFLMDPPSNVSKVTGAFGVMPGAFTSVPQQRVAFKVTAVVGNNVVTLLDDMETTSKMTKFNIAFPPGKYKTLQFSATCTPTCEGGWSYWSKIHFEQDRAAAVK